MQNSRVVKAYEGKSSKRLIRRRMTAATTPATMGALIFQLKKRGYDLK